MSETHRNLIALLALALIAAGTVEGLDHDVPAGAKFSAPSEQAEQLITQGLAELDPAETAPPPDAASQAPKPRGAKPVRLRLLMDGAHGSANDVIELPAKEAAALIAVGAADDDKAAVAYAASLPQNQA